LAHTTPGFLVACITPDLKKLLLDRLD